MGVRAVREEAVGLLHPGSCHGHQDILRERPGPPQAGTAGSRASQAGLNLAAPVPVP